VAVSGVEKGRGTAGTKAAAKEEAAEKALIVSNSNLTSIFI
jgi:hypothetical protein